MTLLEVKTDFVKNEMLFLRLFYLWLYEMSHTYHSDTNKETFQNIFKLASFLSDINRKDKMVPDLFDPHLFKEMTSGISFVSALQIRLEKENQLGMRSIERNAILEYQQSMCDDIVNQYYKLFEYTLSPLGHVKFYIKYNILKVKKSL